MLHSLLYAIANSLTDIVAALGFDFVHKLELYV